MMRALEYVVVAPGSVQLLERLSSELEHRRVADAGLNLASAYPGAHGDLVLACDDLNALEAAVVDRPSGGGI
jgi:hypothetical protein